MNEEQKKQSSEPVVHIEGRFVWHRGMLFFKPDEGTMHGMPLRASSAGTPTFLGLAGGYLMTVPVTSKIKAGLPEELYAGYEMVIGILIDNLSIPVGVGFIRHLVASALYPLTCLLKEELGIGGRATSDAVGTKLDQDGAPGSSSC